MTAKEIENKLQQLNKEETAMSSQIEELKESIRQLNLLRNKLQSSLAKAVSPLSVGTKLVHRDGKLIEIVEVNTWRDTVNQAKQNLVYSIKNSFSKAVTTIVNMREEMRVGNLRIATEQDLPTKGTYKIIKMVPIGDGQHALGIVSETLAYKFLIRYFSWNTDAPSVNAPAKLVFDTKIWKWKLHAPNDRPIYNAFDVERITDEAEILSHLL